MSTSQNDDNLDEGFEDLDAAPEDTADNAPVTEDGGDPLAAPSRNMTSGGGSKKNLFILLGIVAVLALGGGGAYMFLMGGDDLAPATPVAAVPDASSPTEATFAAPTDTSATPVDAAATPPMPDPAAPPDALATAPAAIPGIDAPAADPAAMPPVDPTAMPPVDPTAMPPVDPTAMPPVDPTAAAVVPADPAAATVETTVTTTTVETTTMSAQEEPADLGAPPAEENIALPLNTAPPSDTATAPPSDTATAPPSDQNIPPVDSATAVSTVTTTTAPVTPASGEPQPDLPMPEQAAVPATTTTTTTVSTTVTQPATPAGTTDPSAAELAIVQNAAILDTVTQPSTRPFDPNAPAPSPVNAMKEVEKLLQQEAIVRPLPPAWLQVKKNYDADDMDSRLTAARSALGQNRNSAALQLFTELKTKYPKDYRVLMGRAVALQKLGQNDEALGAYEEVLNANPKNLEALTNMLGLLKGNDPQLAIAKLAELHDAYPYQADITAQLGVAHGQAGEYEQALRYLDMAEAMDPGSAYVVYNKAVLYDKMGHSAQAGDLYRQLLRMAADGTLDENLPLDQIKRRLSVLR